jgi:hypothetical protein
LKIFNNVNVVERGEQARAHLETALMRIIAARKAAVGDPAAYHGGERSNVPGLAAGAAVGEGSDDSLSTTERFLMWRGHGGPP